MITQVALASHIDADPMTVSGILDRLEKRGLLERYPHPNDSRAKLSRLTPDGVEMVAAARHLGKTLYDAALDGLDEAERQALISSLSRMRDNLNNTDQMAEQQEAV
jgi:DNA-binding MarR family transcriptional regulator